MIRPSNFLRAPAVAGPSQIRPESPREPSRYFPRAVEASKNLASRIAKVLSGRRPSNATLVAIAQPSPQMLPRPLHDFLDEDAPGGLPPLSVPDRNAAADEREPLLIQLLFAAKDLAETNIRITEPAWSRGPGMVRDRTCRECGLGAHGAGTRIIHARHCKTGRVLDTIAALEKLSLESNPVEQAGETAARR